MNKTHLRQELTVPLTIMSGVLAWAGMLVFETLTSQVVPVSLALILIGFELAMVGIIWLNRIKPVAANYGLTIAITALCIIVAYQTEQAFFEYLLVLPIGLNFGLLGNRGVAAVWFMLGVAIVLTKSSPSSAVLVFLGIHTAYVLLIGSRVLKAFDEQGQFQMQLARELENTRARRAELVRLTRLLGLSQRNISLMNAQLAHAREVAEKARQMKAQFAANVSHELRTPINLIVGFSEVIATSPESYNEPLPSEYRADFHAIYRNASHLQSLINDILDISQIEADHMALMRKRCSPAQVIHEATNMIRDTVESKGLDFEVDIRHPLPDVWIDMTRIRQVILNLLANAVRFTERGSVRLVAVHEGAAVKISISDTGVGIPEKYLENVFEEFFQTHLSAPGEGTGLGLALSRDFVKLHGGEMNLHSEFGRGTTFWFTLPVDATGGERTLAQRSSGMVGKRAIVVIDDDPAIHQLFSGHIREHEVIVCPAWDEAQRTIQQVLPAAVVVSQKLPHLHNQIKQISPSTTVISIPMPSGRRAIQALGVHDYLVKPVSRDDLLAAIDRIPTPVKSVMVIDDNRDIVRMFRRMLSAYSLRQAMDGDMGLRLLRQQQPDLVVLDILMPGLDGFGVIRAMKAEERLANIPIIVASARGASESITATSDGEIRLMRSSGFAPMELVRQIDAIVRELRIPNHPASP